MESDPRLLRDPQRIDTLNQLEIAKRRAEINASQDRLLLQNNLSEIKEKGPQVILKTIVLPIAAVGVGLYAVSKVVGSLTRDDSRAYYYEPDYDYESEHQPTYPDNAPAPRAIPVAAKPKRSLTTKLITILPLAIKATKMGVSYLEKNGTRVPTVLHDLLSGPGVSAQQKA